MLLEDSRLFFLAALLPPGAPCSAVTRAAPWLKSGTCSSRVAIHQHCFMSPGISASCCTWTGPRLNSCCSVTLRIRPVLPKAMRGLYGQCHNYCTWPIAQLSRLFWGSCLILNNLQVPQWRHCPNPPVFIFIVQVRVDENFERGAY